MSDLGRCEDSATDPRGRLESGRICFERLNADTTQFHNTNLFAESPWKLNPTRLLWKSEHFMHYYRSLSLPTRTRSGERKPHEDYGQFRS